MFDKNSKLVWRAYPIYGFNGFKAVYTVHRIKSAQGCVVFFLLCSYNQFLLDSRDSWAAIFLNENLWISIEISLKFVLTGSINNIPAFLRLMAWRRPVGKPWSEPTMNSLLTHICGTWPQLVNHIINGSDTDTGTIISGVTLNLWFERCQTQCSMSCVHISWNLMYSYRILQ